MGDPVASQPFAALVVGDQQEEALLGGVPGRAVDAIRPRQRNQRLLLLPVSRDLCRGTASKVNVYKNANVSKTCVPQ